MQFFKFFATLDTCFQLLLVTLDPQEVELFMINQRMKVKRHWKHCSNITRSCSPTIPSNQKKIGGKKGFRAEHLESWPCFEDWGNFRHWAPHLPLGQHQTLQYTSGTGGWYSWPLAWDTLVQPTCFALVQVGLMIHLSHWFWTIFLCSNLKLYKPFFCPCFIAVNWWAVVVCIPRHSVLN